MAARGRGAGVALLLIGLQMASCGPEQPERAEVAAAKGANRTTAVSSPTGTQTVAVEPVSNRVPARELPEPVIDSLPPHQPITAPVPHPDESHPVEYGAYLASIGNCFDCHTPFTSQGQPIMELAFAGGRAINGPWGEIASGNITPDASGISHYNEALFISTMRTCRSGARELHRIMPCRFYDTMTDQDLGSIFAWIQTLDPIAHRMSNTDPPTPCKLCGGKHGLGEMN